ncbi:MAG: M1 family aminopeptidase [Candidatus Fermentibacteraceae bacterium]
MLSLLLAVLCAQPHVRLDNSALRRPAVAARALRLVDHPPNPCDILHYDVDIEVFRDTEEIEGITGITLTSAGGTVSEIRLDLRQVAADSVWDDTGPLDFYTVEDSIFIVPSSPVTPSDTVDIWVAYSGQPYHEAWGGFWFNNAITYHIGVGIYTEGQCMGKCAFPCWDHQNDKASMDFHITCPDTLYAVANGDSAGVDYAGGKATYHWEFGQQMPTYLAMLAVGDYTVLHDSADSRIYYYVYSWDVEDALGSYVNVDAMLANLETLFGPYPWDCKFSLVQTPKGDMEHTSAVSHVAFAVNGNTNYDWLIAHEMTHHWWGCCVTMADWTDIWLKEGFAVLGEALWMETYGEAEYRDYVLNEIMIPYLQSGEMFPISDPTTPAEIFSYTTYEKAGAVLHMLRYVLGDVDYFGLMQDYFDQYAYGLVETTDFRDAVEAYTGGDIDWFFDTWIHGEGYPVYDLEYSWQQSGSQWEVTVDLQQVQTVGPVFEMPLQFRVQGASQDTVVVMWNDAQTQTETFTVGFAPQSVEFDPYDNILCGNKTGLEDRPAPPAGTGTMLLGVNPARTATAVVWPGMEGQVLRTSVYDLAGRRVERVTMQPGARELDVSRLPAGTYLVRSTTEDGYAQTARMVVVP